MKALFILFLLPILSFGCNIQIDCSQAQSFVNGANTFSSTYQCSSDKCVCIDGIRFAAVDYADNGDGTCSLPANSAKAAAEDAKEAAQVASVTTALPAAKAKVKSDIAAFKAGTMTGAALLSDLIKYIAAKDAL